jgi:hypothetical protein
MKIVTAFICLFLASLASAATPIVDGRFTGTLNSVQSGAVFTWQSGSTIVVDAGATVTGLQRTNSTLTTLAGITFSSYSQGLFPLTTRTAYFDAIAPSPTTGDVIYYNGTHWVSAGIGTSGQVLTVTAGVPAWAGSASGAPSTATYITQTADAGLSAEFAMGSLGTGLVKNATTTGIPSIAVAGTDYVAPGSATTSGVTMSTARVLGRTTASTGAIEELTFSGVLDQIGNTRGSILERGASGWQIVSPGTSTYVWTSNGSGADPSWQASAGGGSGTVNSGTATQIAYYASSGTAVSSSAQFTVGASGNPSITASGSNQNITLTPSGTGLNVSASGAIFNTVNTDAQVLFGYQFSSPQYYPGIWFGAAASSPSFSNYTFLASNVGETFFGASSTKFFDFGIGGTSQFRITDSGSGALFTAMGSNKNLAFAPSGTGKFVTSGNVQISSYGAGTLTTDASGNVTAVSDERLKNIQGEFTRGLSDLSKIRPILYRWNEKSSNETGTTYAGFSAQNIQTAIPEAVGKMPDGFLTLQDRPILAALVNANLELYLMVKMLFGLIAVLLVAIVWTRKK